MIAMAIYFLKNTTDHVLPSSKSVGKEEKRKKKYCIGKPDVVYYETARSTRRRARCRSTQVTIGEM